MQFDGRVFVVKECQQDKLPDS